MVTRLIGDREKGFDSMNEIIFLRPIDDFIHLTKEIFKKGNAITGDFYGIKYRIKSMDHTGLIKHYQ